MSTITITFATQPLDFGPPFYRGQVDVYYNDGTNTSILTERLTTGTSISGYFKEETFVTGQSETINYNQAKQFAVSFNRDHKNVGGTKNLSATVDDNVVTITAKKGTFVDGSSGYDGDVLVIGSFAVDNSVQIPEMVLSVAPSVSVGDCSTIQYSASLTGGTSPYTLKNGTTDLVTGWDGTSTNFNLNRDSINSISATDANGDIVYFTANVPRQLAIGEFKTRTTPYETYSDILIESVNPVSGTTPVEHALTDVADVVGSNYQASNSFPGVFPGQYKLWIKDKYGCEISKIITVTDFLDATEEENPLYFDVPNSNSFIFNESVAFSPSVKKNFRNTNSSNELSDINYRVKQDFDPSDFEGTQFHSSFPFHVITLQNCDGTTKDIAPIMVQENLGSKEKVDCKIFPHGDKTGVYFDGGNLYEPDTTTIIGSSPHQPSPFNNKTFLPDWAELGQWVFIDGLGGFEIKDTSFDDTRGGFFIIETVTASEVAAKIQVTHNIQPYNVFEFYVRVSDIVDKAQITIEKGFSFNEIYGNAWKSELIRNKPDTDRHKLLEWTSSKNRAGLVFQSKIKCKNRLIGGFRPDWSGESETALEDDRRPSLKQSSYMNWILEFEKLSAKQVDKLNMVSGLDGFKVNNLVLTRLSYPEISPEENSNYYTWKCDFGYGGDSLAIQGDETVLEVSTGVVGGGGTGKGGVLYDPINPLTIDGKFVTIDGKLIVVDP